MIELTSKQKHRIKKITQRNKQTSSDTIIKKTKEEVMELSEALQTADLVHITEEIADVLIMLNQYTSIYINEKDLHNQLNRKTKRTLVNLKKVK